MNKKSLLSFLGIITKSGNAVFGNDNVQYRSLKNEISLIVTACDISENSLDKLKNSSLGVEIKRLPVTKDEILSATGNYAAIIGVKNKELAEKLKILINFVESN